MVSKLIIPNKDIVIPGSRESERLLRQDFETIERFLKDNLGAGTTIGVAGKPQLSGEVFLNAGSGIALSESGQNITIASNQRIPNSAAAFVPGVLTARTVQVFTIASPFLTQVDAYFGTAPAAVTGASCANVVVAGQISGSVTLPLSSSGVAEYHLTPTGSVFSEQTSNQFPGDNGINFGPFAHGSMGAYNMQSTANGQIGGFVTNLALNPAQYNPADFVRFGLANAIVNGTNTPTVSTVSWLTDTGGNPAYVDLPITDLPIGGSTATTPISLNAPVNLTTGQHFSVFVHSLDSTKTSLGTSMIYAGATHAAAWSGNTTAQTLYFQDSSIPGVWVAQGDDMYLVMTGGAVGAALSGLVVVSITLTGTPATPGNDLNIALQM